MSKAGVNRIWQYSSNAGGIDKNMKLNSVSIPTPKPDQHLIKIIACALNPVDYKPAEAPILGSLLVKKPATPGIDIAGRIVAPAAGSGLKPGQLVFGAASFSPFAAGGLAEHVVASKDLIIPIPADVNPVHAASLPVAGLTAYGSIIPHVKAGDRIFINGGSGGVGLFGIQMAKAVGCHVTTSCSSKNVDFVRSYGADEVVDYTKGDVVAQLKALSTFDHIVDNVGYAPELYFRAHEYSKPSAQFIEVAGAPTLMYLGFMLKARLWPAFLGGGRRKFATFLSEPKMPDMEQMVQWMREGKIKAVIDSRYAFEQAPEAIRRQKTGRARGKIIVDVAKED